MIEFIGYFAAIFIGISLGLIGGGGSILTVPVLVYLFHIEPVVATAYSLFVVGLTSSVGAFSYFKQGLVKMKMALVFGIPSIFSVFLTRNYLVPAIPNEILNVGDFVLTKGIFLMALFAVLMILASYKMIKSGSKKKETTPIQKIDSEPKAFNYPMVIIQGLIVGLITGLVGAGGGFIIIPALVFLLGLKMKEAIGTSLTIITLNSFFGFLVSQNQMQTDWKLLLILSTMSIIGIFVGMALSKRIDGAKLKPLFGWFVLIMGSYILMKELFF
ncbi:putative permease [Bernardetia litoralis DSM 6794]|uniref:Probable membrane transporter protein n=1 Tax=Bernardetia litoralis (strain ATCC 23117 / DSM 6794 / NBRC 15988 / NCIMB 1366 / Fx l1 / Sio-4) TaxID=880071 RepID=I4AKP8_BERLS|nr:sulfite exporter TauE/SafE family protein [Bernardetia litoralis]AFM04533.1 putative permease [Bernardetia litoralis DSM 6794]